MSELANKIEAAETGGEKEASVLDLVRQSQAQFELALDGTMSSDKFVRVALTALRQNPALQKCSVPSLLGSLMICAQLGLEPTGPLGHAYLVPFGKEVQIIVGYKGMIELAYRSGRVSKVVARTVHEKDTFDYGYGLEDYLTHKPAETSDRGPMTHVYAIGKVVGGEPVSVVLSKAEVDEIRDRFSKGASRKDSPWKTDYESMAKKTAIRRLFTWLPSSTVNQPAMLADGGVVKAQPDPKDMDYDGDVIDVEAVEGSEDG